MHYCATKLIVFLGGCFTVPLALAVPLANGHALGAAASAPATPQSKQQHVCFADLFEGPLPGKADYCIGLRDWNHGHYRNGLEYLKLAAGWGNKSAQYTLGLIYYGGHHVAPNPALGMAWLKLANERRDDQQIALATKSAFKWATPAQRHQADQLFAQMRGKYGDEVAAARAWHHLQRWTNVHNGSNTGCVRVFGAQAAAARRLGLAGMAPKSIQVFLRPSKPNKPPTRKERMNFAKNRAGVCITIHTQHHVTQKVAEKYFAGWLGAVTVGPLKPVPAPATSSGR